MNLQNKNVQNSETYIQTHLVTKASESLEESIQNDLGVSDPNNPNMLASLLETATSGNFSYEKE
jgi:hypothetical protein